MIPTIRHPGKSKTVETVKRSVVVNPGEGTSGRGVRPQGIEDDDAVLCDIVMVDSQRYAFVRNHSTV